jgi:hypothetical protein
VESKVVILFNKFELGHTYLPDIRAYYTTRLQPFKEILQRVKSAGQKETLERQEYPSKVESWTNALT